MILILIFFAAAAVGFFVPSALLWWALRKHKSRMQSQIDANKAQALPELKEPAAPAAPAAPAHNAIWHAMPCGKRLELAGTGFYIVMDPHHKEGVYAGYTPEGALIGRTCGLAVLKAFAEMLAKERALGEIQKQLDDARQSATFYRRRVEALQRWQHKMRDPERTIVCDIIANGCTLDPSHAGNRYTTQRGE